MLFLSVDEVISLTGKIRRPAQVKVLRYMGIEHRIRPDGTVLVSRLHVEKILDSDSVNGRIKRRIEPDWSVFNVKTTP